METEQPPPTPVVPDWTVLTAAVARQAVQGIIAAGHYDSRFSGLDLEAARVLVTVLRLYARFGRAPSVKELVTETALSQQGIVNRLSHLRSRDLVLLAPDGETVVGAYPFTEAKTGHSVTLQRTRHTIATMCAIDALGAGAMCRDDVAIRSICRTCGGEVLAHTSGLGMYLDRVVPVEAVVWVGLRQSCGCAANTLCTQLLFFCSDEHLQRWRQDHGDGHRLTPQEAFQVGKALFIDRAMMGR